MLCRARGLKLLYKTGFIRQFGFVALCRVNLQLAVLAGLVYAKPVDRSELFPIRVVSQMQTNNTSHFYGINKYFMTGFFGLNPMHGGGTGCLLQANMGFSSCIFCYLLGSFFDVLPRDTTDI